jgi:Uma2 family endonuclease
MVDQRVQVGANRYRVPDICVIAEHPREQVLRTPPLICIEILSKNDSLVEMRERVADYLTFGVPYVWVINPAARKAWRCATAGVTEVAELRTQSPDTVIPLAELFEN